jgi:hypothetical protein
MTLPRNPSDPAGAPASGSVLNLSPLLATCVSVGVLAVVAIGDYVTDWYFVFDFFYLIPLVLVTVSLSRRAGILMAFLCTGASTVVMAAQRHPQIAGVPAPGHLILAWNFSMRFAVQVTFVWLIARLVERIAEERRLTLKLRTALEEVKQLGSLLPICAWCKKVRDDAGYWDRIDSYLQKHDLASFTHGICPECARKVEEEFVRDTDQAGPTTIES